MNELEIYYNALLAIAHMDIYTREDEKQSHEVMRNIAMNAILTVEKSKEENNSNQLNIEWKKTNPERKENE